MIRFILALVLLLPSLALARGPYWVKTSESVTVMGIYEVDNTTRFCGPHALACFRRDTGTVYMQKGLPPAEKACVLSHETRHASGWTHPEFEERGFALDCGDGSMWLPNP